MQKQYRLGSNRQFQYVYRRGKRVANRELVFLYVKSSRKKIGFSVSKKIGNAVTRNTIKRRLREILRPQLPELPKGFYVLIARPGIEKISFSELSQSVQQLLKKTSCRDSARMHP